MRPAAADAAAVDAQASGRSSDAGFVRALIAAALSGFAGLGLESLAVSCSGLALGYGASAAIGLATWLAAWALGAGWSARRPPSGLRSLRIAGLAVGVLAPATVFTLLALGLGTWPRPLAATAAVLAIAAPAAVQGVFLPWLARGRRHVAWLFAANLFGSLLGAYVVADLAVGAWGRLPAAILAGLAAVCAGFCAPRTVDSRAEARSDEPAAASTRGVVDTHAIDARDASTRLPHASAALWIGLGVAWASALQWILLRLGVLWFGGMQNALQAVLCASLLALALGALISRAFQRGRTRELVGLLVACALASTWPFVAALVLHGVEDATLFERACVLCVPALTPFGAFVPIVHAAVERHRDSGERLGRLLLHESWGAVLGIPLVHALVVPAFGLSGAVATSLGFGAIAALALWPVARVASVVSCAFVSALAVAAGTRPSPALDSPPLSNPAFRSVELREDRDFAVAVVDDGLLGERTLLTDGFRAAGTGRDYRYMEALGHLPLALHPSPRRVAVLALGTGTTLGAVYLHPEVEHVDVLEISRAVVDAAPAFEEKNHGALAAPVSGGSRSDGTARVVVRLGDGRATLAHERGAYDVITMEPLLPDSPFAVYLYTREFYDVARAALAPGGILCQWVPPHALEPITFDAVLDAFASSFRWSGVWVFGTQVLLVGGDAEPTLDASRFETEVPALRAARASLGFSTTDDVVARWCGAVPRAPSGSRTLRDADPWIVHRPRRQGVALLSDLPINLNRLAPAQAPPPAWRGACSPRLDDRLTSARALRRARVLHGWREIVSRGGPPPRDFDPDEMDVQLQVARGLHAEDLEVQRFSDEVEFLDSLRRGVTLLATSPGADGARAALEPLVRAAELAGERADVHLDCAIALERLGSPAAEKALSRALAACPRLAETPAGQRARALGISDASWERMTRSAELTRGLFGLRRSPP